MFNSGNFVFANIKYLNSILSTITIPLKILRIEFDREYGIHARKRLQMSELTIRNYVESQLQIGYIVVISMGLFYIMFAQ